MPETDWIVVETMGNSDPDLVFKSGQACSFASIGAVQREYLRGSRKVQKCVLELIRRVAASREPFTATEIASDNKAGRKEYSLAALPVFGPRNEVFAIQLWIGPPGESPPAPRLVGAFEWNPNDRVTYHGPNIEQDILGIDNPQPERVTAEIFKHFLAFEEEPRLRSFAQGIAEGILSDGEPFAAEIIVGHERDPDNQLRYRCYMALRAVHRRDTNQWVMRGVVHDINDTKPAQPTDLDRHTARLLAALASEGGEKGIGRLDFATGIIAEWLAPPPYPLDAWLTRNETYHPDDLATVTEIRHQLIEGRVERVSYQAKLTFDKDGRRPPLWHSARVTIVADTLSSQGQGMITVEYIPSLMAF